MYLYCFVFTVLLVPFFLVSSLGWLSSLSFTVAGRLTRMRGPPVGTCNCCIEQNCFIGTWCLYLKRIHVFFYIINDVLFNFYTLHIFAHMYIYIGLYLYTYTYMLHIYLYMYIWYMYIIYMCVLVNCMIEQLPIVWYHHVMRHNSAYLCYIYALDQMNLIMFKHPANFPDIWFNKIFVGSAWSGKNAGSSPIAEHADLVINGSCCSSWLPTFEVFH